MADVESTAASRIPLGWCQCGCGSKTPPAPKTRKERGWIKGSPLLYIHNHHNPLGILTPERIQQMKARQLAAERQAREERARAEAAARGASAAPATTLLVEPVGTPSPLMSYSGGVGIRGVSFVAPWKETQGRASLRPFHREKRRYQGHGYGSPARAAYRP
jgi:hypothetical protein